MPLNIAAWRLPAYIKLLSSTNVGCVFSVFELSSMLFNDAKTSLIILNPLWHLLSGDICNDAQQVY